MLEAIEATMDRYPETEAPPRREYDDAVAAGLVEIFDPYPRFREQLASIVDLERIRGSSGKVLVEPMWGSGAGWFTRLLDGGNLTIRELHTERNPFFGGVNPEPIRPNIDEWLAEIPQWGADIGIAFDGDADRVGMATEDGVFVNQLQVYGLLYWYLLEVRGQIGPAVYTVTTTSMAPRLAELYGTEAYETGVGFKFVGPKMAESNAVIGGEESGGFGFGMHIPERDGLAAGLFLLDLWLTRGRRASEVLAELQALAGPSYYNRIDVRFSREEYPAIKRDTLARLEHEAPTDSTASEVVRRQALDTRRRVQVLPRRRVVAPDPVQRDGGAPPDLCRGPRRRTWRRLLAEGRRIATARRVPRPRERRPRLLRLQAPRRGAGAPSRTTRTDQTRTRHRASTRRSPSTRRRSWPASTART